MYLLRPILVRSTFAPPRTPSFSGYETARDGRPQQLIAINDQTLAGAPFDVAMDAMIALEGPDVEFTLFRGTTDELKEVVGASISTV